MKKFTAFVLSALLLLACHCSALAATPYRTFTLGVDGDLVQTQTAYDPIRTMTRFGEETLKTPADLRMGPDGNLYIADTGNKRILVVTKDGEFVKEIGSKKTLKSPKGVFVAEDLSVYVADENGRKVVVFDQDGKVIREYERPTHPLFGEGSPYKPNKIVLDKRGNLYIASTGSTNGIIQISPTGEEGEFLGYYGANQSTVSFLTSIKKALFSQEQLSNMAGIVPTSVRNLTIDGKGMVYTVSQSNDTSTLRRLNVAGKDTLTPDWWYEMNTAVAVNSSGAIFTANANGYIMEYTSEGDTLFIFGAFDYGDQRVGTFKSVTGLVADDDYTLYVLDEILGSIQVLKPTEFTDLVHSAFRLFQDGKYAESKEPWQDVLRMNSLFTYASTGLGEALYREGNYEEALEAYRNGGSQKGYSDAFWELRSNWLHTNMGAILITIVVLVAAWIVIKFLNKKTGFLKPVIRAKERVTHLKPVWQMNWCMMMLKNPFDCCYGIKREKRTSCWAATGIVFIYFVMHVVNKYFSGFLFRTVPEGYYELFNDFVTVFAVFLMLVICCYLVCTIKEGEASFKNIYVGGAFALTPLLIALPIQLLLTNVLTYNEQFFITMLQVVAYGWTGLLIVLMLMYLNDYSFKQTLWIIVLTLFTVLIAAALLFVVYVLISQLIDFISSIYGEVVYRFVKKA
ncbi:MAG: hypothetical protein IJD39_10150 [Clostridia bacterium]|nr:hypothetical protein [Clostridia bacterium]